jgi:ferredoxin-NADP reductase
MIEVRVQSVKETPGGVRELTFVPIGSDPLPPFSPGSHVIVHLPGEPDLRNAYSLASPPWETSSYRIAVRLVDEGRGGSRRLHERVGEGDLICIEPPRNLFALQTAARAHLLVAGGIGITPFVSWLHQLRREETPFELLYAGRPEDVTGILSELEALAPGAVRHCGNRIGLMSALAEALVRQRLGTHLAACGPGPMMDAVVEAARDRGWPPERVHLERFVADRGVMEPFEAVLGRDGRRLSVSAAETLLEALEKSGLKIPYQCRQGICGQCVTGVLGGTPDHRDIFLSAEEHAAGQKIMPCISRCAKGGELVLDLP